MDKKSFLTALDLEDKNLLSNLYDKISLAEKTQKTIFSSEFLTPNVWRMISNLEHNFEVNIYTNGVFEECERRILAFSKNEVEEFPVVVVKITNESKFQTLKHKDFLGAIMSLGIKREKFGDMIVKDNTVYVAVYNDISDYLIQNLNYVGKCPCSLEKVVDPETYDLRPESENMLINVASLRMDSLVGAICNISRSKAVDMIDSAKVLFNYDELREKDKSVQMQDTLTIRGYGKYKIIENMGTTQKGRLRILIKKYI